MNTQELLGLNTKWYRYQKKMTQEQFAEKTKFKMAYISLIECGHANPTCSNIDIISDALDIEVINLFNKQTAIKAKNYQLELINIIVDNK